MTITVPLRRNPMSTGRRPMQLPKPAFMQMAQAAMLTEAQDKAAPTSDDVGAARASMQPTPQITS